MVFKLLSQHFIYIYVVERKVEDGDNTNGLQAEDNVLAEAKSHNVHDEG